MQYPLCSIRVASYSFPTVFEECEPWTLRFLEDLSSLDLVRILGSKFNSFHLNNLFFSYFTTTST